MATISGVSPLTQYFIDGAMQGYVDIVAPLMAYSYNVNQAGAVLNDHVRVPFASSPNSASSVFTYAGGYSGNNGLIQGKDVTLNTLLYQPLQLTDAEMAVLPPAVLTMQGNLLGRRLGADVVSASLSVVTTANYTLTSSYSSSQFTASVALADIDQQANKNKWPDGVGYRNLVAGTFLWNNLLSNNNINQAYAFGGVSAIQEGRIPALFGFQPYKTTTALQPGIDGFISTPNALVVAFAYHQPAPQASSILVSQQRFVDEKTGVVMGYREWYDPIKATVNRIFDSLSGVTTGDTNALITIRK